MIYTTKLSKFELFWKFIIEVDLFRFALKSSEDSFYELQNLFNEQKEFFHESTRDIQEKLSDSLKERDKLQRNLGQTEEKLKKLEIITERARELFGPSVSSEKESGESICGICFEAFDDFDRKRKTFIPCGHVACGTCAPKILASDCHICRKTVESLITLFL